MDNRYFGIAATVALALLATAVAAQSGSPRGLADQLRGCAAETDSTRRLACYDQISSDLPPGGKAAAAVRNAAAAPAATAAPTNVAGAPTSAAGAAAGTADFGVDNGPLQAKQARSKPQLMTALVAGVSTRPHGELVMTLDNGQTWVQNQVSYFPVKPGDKVEINVGAIGSYVMWVPSARRASKVTRVD